MYFTTDLFVRKIIEAKSTSNIITGGDFRDVDFPKIAKDFGSNFLDKLEFTRCDFRGSDLSNFKFQANNFLLSEFNGAKFEGCNFIDTTFSRSNLLSVSFKKIAIVAPSDFKIDQFTQLSTDSFIDIYQAIPSENREAFRKEIFKDTDLRLIDFQEFLKTAGTDSLIGFSFLRSDLTLADLSYFNLNKVDFSQSIIDNVIFDNAFLKDVDFKQASLVGASLTKIKHDGVYTIFKNKSLQGTKVSTSTLIQLLELLPKSSNYFNLKSYIFKGMDVSEVDFKEVDAKLGAKALVGCDFTGTIFFNKDFGSLDISETHLQDSILTKVTLRETTMSWQQFYVFLSKAKGTLDFSKVKLVGEVPADLANVLRNPTDVLLNIILPEQARSLAYRINNPIGPYIQDLKNKQATLRDGSFPYKAKAFSLRGKISNRDIVHLSDLNDEQIHTFLNNREVYKNLENKVAENYILTKDEKNQLKNYKDEIKKYSGSYLETKAENLIRIKKANNIDTVFELVNEIRSDRASRLFRVKLKKGEMLEKIFIIKKNKYNLITNEVVHIDLLSTELRDILLDKMQNYKQKISIELASIKLEVKDPNKWVEPIYYENYKLSEQDKRLGEITIAGSSKIRRVDLYNLHLQIQHPGEEKKLIDSKSDFLQSEFDDIRIHKHINAERYLEQLTWAFEKNNLLKVKILLELKRKVIIDDARYENVLSKIDSTLKAISGASTSHLKSNSNFYSVNERAILLAFIRDEIDTAKSQKISVIDKLTYIKNKHTQHKIKLRTSEQLLLYKSVFDIYRSLIFQGSSEGFTEGLFLFYAATYLLPTGNHCILTYGKGRIPFRKYAGGLLLTSPDFYGFYELSKNMYSIFKGDIAAFSFDARNLYIDLTSTSTSVVATFRELIKNTSSWKTGLVILGGTVILKGVSKFGEDLIYYYLPTDESIYSVMRGMLDLPDSAHIDKLKKKQAYSDYIYQGLVAALNEENDLVIAGASMGALGNELGSWEITDAYFERMRSGKSKLNRGVGKNAAPRKVGRPKRLAPKRKYRPKQMTDEQVQEDLKRVNRIQENRHLEFVKEQEEKRPKPTETFIDLSTHVNKPVKISLSNAPTVLSFISNYFPPSKVLQGSRRFGFPSSSSNSHISSAPICALKYRLTDTVEGIMLPDNYPFFNCTNALVLAKKDLFQQMHQLKDFKEKNDITNANKLITEWKKKYTLIDGGLISSGSVKGFEMGPANYFIMGKGNATYLGGEGDCTENYYVLPASHFGGKVIGGKSSSNPIKNLLNVSKASETVIFKNNLLEGNMTVATTSDITDYVGRLSLPESVECFDMPLERVDAQGGQYGNFDKIIACKTVILSGFEDVESHTDNEHYEFILKQNAKGFSSITLPNAKEIIIKLSDISVLVKKGKLFYKPAKKTLEILIENFHLSVFAPELKENGLKFFDEEKRTVFLNLMELKTLSEIQKGVPSNNKDLPINSLVVNYPIDAENFNSTTFLSENLNLFSSNINNVQINLLDKESAKMVARLGNINQNVFSTKGLNDLEFIQGNEESEIINLDEENLQNLMLRGKSLVIDNKSDVAAIDRLKLPYAINKIEFRKELNDLRISEGGKLIRIINYFSSAEYQHLIFVDVDNKEWILGAETSVNNLLTIKPLPIYFNIGNKVLTLESIEENPKIALNLDLSELIFYRLQDDLLLSKSSEAILDCNANVMILEDYFIDPSKWSALQFLMGNFEDARLLMIGESTSGITYLSSNELQKLALLAIDLEQTKKDATRLEEKNVTFYKLGKRQLYDKFYHNQCEIPHGECNSALTKGVIEVNDNARHFFLNSKDHDLMYTFQDNLGKNKTFVFHNGAVSSVNEDAYLPYRPDMIIGKNLFVQDLSVAVELFKLEEKINSALLGRWIVEQQKKELNESPLLHLKAFIASSVLDREALLDSNFSFHPGCLGFNTMDELVLNLSPFFVLFRDKALRQQAYQALFEDKSFAASETVLFWNIFQAKFQFGLTDETICQCYSFLNKKNIEIFLKVMENQGVSQISNMVKLWKLKNSEKSILRHLAGGGKLYNVPSNLSNRLSSVSYTTIEDNAYLNLEGVAYSEIRFLPVGSNILYMYLGDFTTSALSETNFIVTIHDPNRNFFKGIIDTEMGWEFAMLQEYNLEQLPVIQAGLNKAIAESKPSLKYEEVISIPNRSYKIIPIYDIYTPIEYEGGEDCMFSLKGLDYTDIVINEIPQEGKLTFTILLSSGQTRIIASKWLEKDYRLCGFCDEEKNWKLEGLEKNDLTQVKNMQSKITAHFNRLRSSGALYLNYMQGDQAQPPVETHDQMLGDQPVARLLAEKGYAISDATQPPPLAGTNTPNLSSMMNIITQGMEVNATLLAAGAIVRSLTGNNAFQTIPSVSIEKQQKEKIEEIEATVMFALREVEKKSDWPESETSSNFWNNWPLIGAIVSAAGLGIASIGGLFYYFKQKKHPSADVDVEKEMNELLSFANADKDKEKFNQSAIPSNEHSPLFGDYESGAYSSSSASFPHSVGKPYAENDWSVTIMQQKNIKKQENKNVNEN